MMAILVHFSILISLSFLLTSKQYQYKMGEYIFKPLTIFLIILLPFLYLSWADFPLYGKWIVLGLLFSAVGDICLMFEKLFKLGMLSFLLGHVSYFLAVFSESGFHLNQTAFIIFTLWLVFAVTTLPLLTKSLKVPVIIYSLTLTFLIWQSHGLYAHNHLQFSVLFLAGILMFAASDWILIRNKFLPNGMESLKLPLYFLGQMLIAYSVVYHC